MISKISNDFLFFAVLGYWWYNSWEESHICPPLDVCNWWSQHLSWPKRLYSQCCLCGQWLPTWKIPIHPSSNHHNHRRYKQGSVYNYIVHLSNKIHPTLLYCYHTINHFLFKTHSIWNKNFFKILLLFRGKSYLNFCTIDTELNLIDNKLIPI